MMNKSESCYLWKAENTTDRLTLYVVEHIITLVVNGSATTVLTSVEPYNWNDTEDTNLFIGRSTSTYFSGFIDDVSARINNNHVMATN